MLQAVLVHEQKVPPVRSACELTVMRDVSPALFGIMSGSISVLQSEWNHGNLSASVSVMARGLLFFPGKKRKENDHD